MDDNAGMLWLEGGMWAVLGVTDQPVVRLTHWSVSEIDGGSRHVMGWNVMDEEGRVSTAIERIDAETATLMTRSGRRYELVGPSGWHVDASWVWSRWCQARGVTRVTDVSAEYAWLIREAAP